MRLRRLCWWEKSFATEDIIMFMLRCFGRFFSLCFHGYYSLHYEDKSCGANLGRDDNRRQLLFVVVVVVVV